MMAKGYPVSSKGVAMCYGDILDVLVIDDTYSANGWDFEVRTVRLDTIMTSVDKSQCLASIILGLFKTI